MSDETRFSRIAEQLISVFRGGVASRQSKNRRPTFGIEELVREAVKKYRIGVVGPEVLVREQWSGMVGNINAAHSYVTKVDENGVLIVLTNHSVVRTEISFRRRQILERVRTLPGCETVRDIVIRAA